MENGGSRSVAICSFPSMCITLVIILSNFWVMGCTYYLCNPFFMSINQWTPNLKPLTMRFIATICLLVYLAGAYYYMPDHDDDYKPTLTKEEIESEILYLRHRIKLLEGANKSDKKSTDKWKDKWNKGVIVPIDIEQLRADEKYKKTKMKNDIELRNIKLENEYLKEKVKLERIREELKVELDYILNN